MKISISCQVDRDIGTCKTSHNMFTRGRPQAIHDATRTAYDYMRTAYDYIRTTHDLVLVMHNIVGTIHVHIMMGIRLHHVHVDSMLLS